MLEGHPDDWHRSNAQPLPTGLQKLARTCGNYGRWRVGAWLRAEDRFPDPCEEDHFTR